MKRFIVTGDWHFKGMNPRARLDNYQEALTRKINEVFWLAVRYKADAVIVPGDVIDSPATTISTIVALGTLLQLAPCPVLTIPGNHDLWSANPGSKFRTPYGLLASLKLIRDITEEPFESINESTGLFGNATVTGHGYTIETDTEAGMSQFAPPPSSESYRDIIHLVHSMLMAKSPGFDMRHTLISQVKTTAKVIISGHEHTGFNIVRRDDGVLFINPGALCRLSASQAEMERQVQVVLLTVNDNGQADAELIPLRSALPGWEVLSREHLEQEQEKQDRISKFFDLLVSEGAGKFLEVRDIVADIASRKNIPDDVKAETLKRIDAAREKLKSEAV